MNLIYIYLTYSQKIQIVVWLMLGSKYNNLKRLFLFVLELFKSTYLLLYFLNQSLEKKLNVYLTFVLINIHVSIFPQIWWYMLKSLNVGKMRHLRKSYIFSLWIGSLIGSKMIINFTVIDVHQFAMCKYLFSQ